MTTEDKFVVIKRKISNYEKQGYDRIHIPGGTSKDGEHYSGVFLYHFDKKSKEILFLGVPYSSKFYLEHKSNGHTKRSGETPKETARREVLEETGLFIEEGDLDLVLQYHIPNRIDKTKTHQKNFYCTNKYSGTLYSFEGPNPIDGETSSPLWIPYNLFRKVLFGGHQQALQLAVRRLRNLSADYYYALR